MDSFFGPRFGSPPPCRELLSSLEQHVLYKDSFESYTFEKAPVFWPDAKDHLIGQPSKRRKTNQGL